MKYGSSNTPSLAEIPRDVRRALIACGLWLRVAIIGALGVLAGLAQLFEGEARPLAALALAAGGTVLAALGWWRAQIILDAADGASAGRVTAPVPTGARAVAGL